MRFYVNGCGHRRYIDVTCNRLYVNAHRALDHSYAPRDSRYSRVKQAPFKQFTHNNSIPEIETFPFPLFALLYFLFNKSRANIKNILSYI